MTLAVILIHSISAALVVFLLVSARSCINWYANLCETDVSKPRRLASQTHNKNTTLDLAVYQQVRLGHGWLGSLLPQIYHSSLRAFGEETSLSMGPTGDTRIETARPGKYEEGRLVKVIRLGDTNVTKEQFRSAVDTVGKQFTVYDAVNHNCYDFCHDVVREVNPRLSLPYWPNRLAAVGKAFLFKEIEV